MLVSNVHRIRYSQFVSQPVCFCGSLQCSVFLFFKDFHCLLPCFLLEELALFADRALV